jgi:sporulation protein YlmC with PRC-barrel domain
MANLSGSHAFYRAGTKVPVYGRTPMMKKAITAAVLGLSLAALPALAQNNTGANNSQANAKNDQPHQTASQMNLWPSSKLKGLNVYNQNNEKIGDISDLMTNKEGKIDVVVISVGGFLGIGSHDVAVKWNDLKWEMQPVRTSSTAPAGNAAGNRPAGTVGTGSAANNTASDNSSKQFWPDHTMMANATKDQLKAMPQFDATK